MKSGKYLSVEAPDSKVVIDFLDAGGCSVTVELETNSDGTKRLYVRALAADDRATIILDNLYPIPADEGEDEDEGDDDEGNQ